MTAPCPVDPAAEVINTFMDALRAWFPVGGPCPPVGGGTATVRFFATDGGGLPWEPTAKEPVFLWLRLAGRYRSTAQVFPESFRGALSACRSGSFTAIGVEVGVERCTSMQDDGSCGDWATLEFEADRSRDDSYRLFKALCLAEQQLSGPERLVAIDTVEPRGPEGGVIGWTGMAYVQV